MSYFLDEFHWSISNRHYDTFDDYDEANCPSYGTRSKDPLYYHKQLFRETDNPYIVRETEKAYLFEVNGKLFWCPKSLIRNNEAPISEWKVWKRFYPEYIHDNELTVKQNCEKRKSNSRKSV